MKKLLKAAIMVAMIMSLGATPVLAGNTNYSTLFVTNTAHTHNFICIEEAPNTKATVNHDWYFNVSNIEFSHSTSGTLGMAFTPVLKGNSKIEVVRLKGTTVGAEVAWKTKAFSGSEFRSWYGNGSLRTYYLGVRLDTELSMYGGTAKGYWNAY